MGNSNDLVFALLIVACAIGVFTVFLGLFLAEDIRELGSAICDDFDMDFKKYKGDIVFCKDRVVKNQTKFQGITIMVYEGK